MYLNPNQPLDFNDNIPYESPFEDDMDDDAAEREYLAMIHAQSYWP